MTQWKMMPVEPTQEMLDAMQSSGWMPANYSAMLAAAPAAPEAAQQQELYGICMRVAEHAYKQGCGRDRSIPSDTLRTIVQEVLRVPEAVQAEPTHALTGEKLRSLFLQLQPLAEMTTEDEVASWWKHYAGAVRLALKRATPEPPAMSEAVRDVIAERCRQVEVEGWTPEHDDSHNKGELRAAAACYALFNTFPRPPMWPWDAAWWKPAEDNRRNLVKAGALILAEIERLDRAALVGGKEAP